MRSFILFLPEIVNSHQNKEGEMGGAGNEQDKGGKCIQTFKGQACREDTQKEHT
jgi:hypothetical protein